MEIAVGGDVIVFISIFTQFFSHFRITPIEALELTWVLVESCTRAYFYRSLK